MRSSRTLAVVVLFLSTVVVSATAVSAAGATTAASHDSDGELVAPLESGTEASNVSDGTLEIHALNVGQADATLVVGPSGETVLIDTGDWRDDGETVLDALEARGIDRIDHLVATHGHADHVGGHEAVIDHFETEGEGIGAAYDSGVVHTSRTYERYLDAVERHEVPLYEVRSGDEIPMSNVTVEVLNPPAEGVDRESGDLHANSVALKLTYGETSFLLTGDVESGTERRLVETRGDDLAADVYFAGHHGSDTSSSAPFLDTVEPAAAVVSSAYDSQYGHPHEETLERFAERSVATFWTATHGTVALESDGAVIAVRTQAAAPTGPRALRRGDRAESAVDPPHEVRQLFVPGVPCDSTPFVGATPGGVRAECGSCG